MLDLKTLPRLSVLAGPAGVGKTQASLEYFLELTRQAGNPFAADVLYLLPSAEHRERIIDLMLRKEGTGFFGERVLTFNRLMQELLKAGEFSLATDAQRRFLLNEIVSNHTGAYFANVRDLSGFIETISDFVGELKESMMSLPSFRSAVGRLKKMRPEWGPKYEALLEIYEEYEKRLEALGLRDHRDGLFLLRGRASAKERGLPKFRHLFVDGFFDFSRSQLEFLGWLRERSERVTLAMTVDLSEERKGLFEIPRQTLDELKKRGFQVVDLSGSTNHRISSEALTHLEKNLFAENLSRYQVPFEKEVPGTFEENSAILILEATGLRGEMEMIAREIRRLIRTRGLNFSDIAVILRRVGEYEDVIRAVFAEFGIPFEMHERERLRAAPLARTLVSFFKLFLEDWKRGDLFNFLKSRYVDSDYERVCSLELQALRLGMVSGREHWLKEMKDPLFEKIAAFQDKFQAAESVEEWLKLTREVLTSFGLDRIAPVYEEGVRRDFMTLRRLAGLLREIESASFAQAGPQKSFERFSRELLGLIEVDLFSLHERDKNRVQVYDISLARQKEYKVVFLAGLLEKFFPVEIREDPVLSDEERREMGLAERLPRQAVERYFFYLGLTRAREKVVLSYPRFDLEGREALPSFYVDEVEELFQEPLPKRSCAVNQSLPRLEDVVEERELAAHAVWRLHKRTFDQKEERARTLALYNRLLNRDSFRDLLGRILFDPVAQIEDPAVRSAFRPKDGIFRPTGLEAHGRCPYRYFASTVLELEEREEGIDVKLVGILLHEVLERYWRERVEKGRKELEGIEEAKNFALKTLYELLAQSPLTGEKAYRIELKRAEMEKWLGELLEDELEGKSGVAAAFEPRHFEFEFGFKNAGARSGRPEGGVTPPLRLYDPYHEDLLLRGKIDRIDVDKSGKYGLVIDYKTGASFKKEDLAFGTALQLPLYLLVIQQHLKLKPAGGEIYQIARSERKGFYSREALEETLVQTRSRNVLDKKDFDALFEQAIWFSRKFAKGIQEADISVRPRDCNPHCPFPALCRIEKWRLTYLYQEIRDEDRRNRTV